MRGVRCGMLVGLLACGRQDSLRVDSGGAKLPPAPTAATRTDTSSSVAAGSLARAAAAPASTTAATCVSEGEWQQCSVAKRLTDAGYVPIEKGASPTGIFAVPGTSYRLGSAELHVYLFKSAKDREAAVAGIDTVAVARRGTTQAWPLQPTLIMSNNLVAVLVSDNGRQIERVQNAIIAGLPRASRVP